MMIDQFREQGSALVETTIFMLVMIPLLFGLVSTGNLIDLIQTGEQAARYANWETTVRDDGDMQSVSDSVSVRFFGVPNVGISTISNSRIYSSSDEQIVGQPYNRLWGISKKQYTSNYSGPVVRVNSDDVEINFQSTDTGNSVATEVGENAARSGKVLENIAGNEWGLSHDGLLKAVVTVPIESAQLHKYGVDCGDSGDRICIFSSGVILNDDWSSAGSQQTKRRVRSLMPASILEPVGNAISHAGNIPLFGELKGLRGAFGHVDTSELQEYRGR